MEVVLDVNVLVSAVLSGAGPAAQLVTAMRDDRLSVVACPALVAELTGVLQRDRFRPYLSLDEVDEYAGEIEGLCRMVDDPDPVPAVLWTTPAPLPRLQADSPSLPRPAVCAITPRVR